MLWILLLIGLTVAGRAEAALITFVEKNDVFTSSIGTPVSVDPVPLPLVSTPPFFLVTNGPNAHAARLNLPFAELSVSESGAWWFPEAPNGPGINVVRFFGQTATVPHILFISDVTDPLTIAAVKDGHNFLPEGKLVEITGDGGESHHVFLSDGRRFIPEPGITALMAACAPVATCLTLRRRRYPQS
jgi:hypothetical protein